MRAPMRLSRRAGFHNQGSRLMADAQQQLNVLYKNISQVLIGKKDAILLTLATLLCRGHLLIEDVPGVGKTMLARALASSLDVDFKRIQCTPDLMPTDVTGVSIFNQKTAAFEFVKGPVFTSVLLADEINRTTPRTQSSLLECMAERQVTVDGTTHLLHDVFMVIATQNPVDFHGTYPLPEAQLDRFFMRIGLGYPGESDELTIMSMQNEGHPIDGVRAVMSAPTLLALQNLLPKIRVEPSVAQYIAALVRATREHPDLELGASPRGSIALGKAARALALLSGKAYVTPQLVKQVAVPVLAHRLIVRQQAMVLGKTGADVVQDVMRKVPVPVTQPAGA